MLHVLGNLDGVVTLGTEARKERRPIDGSVCVVAACLSVYYLLAGVTGDYMRLAQIEEDTASRGQVMPQLVEAAQVTAHVGHLDQSVVRSTTGQHRLEWHAGRGRIVCHAHAIELAKGAPEVFAHPMPKGVMADEEVAVPQASRIVQQLGAFSGLKLKVQRRGCAAREQRPVKVEERTEIEWEGEGARPINSVQVCVPLRRTQLVHIAEVAVQLGKILSAAVLHKVALPPYTVRRRRIGSGPV